MERKQLINMGVAFIVGLAAGIVAMGLTGGYFNCKKDYDKLEYFSRKMDLTDGQQNRVKEIFNSYKPQLQQLHSEVRPKFESIREEINREIRKELTPEQTVKFEELQKEMEDKRKERYKRRGFGTSENDSTSIKEESFSK